MSDKARNNEQVLREIEDKRKKGLVPPEIMRGDEIHVGDYRAIVYGILFDMAGDPGPSGYQVGVVFLDNNQGMANLAKWSESDRCWKFLEGEIPRNARPALDKLVKKLRFKLVK